MHGRVFIPEDICNQSPSLCTNIPCKKTPPLLIGGPSDHLLQISRQQGAIEAVVQVILLLFYASLNVALSISALCQCIPHQACVYAPLP